MGGTPGWTYASQKFVVVEPSNPLGMILQGNNANQGVNLTLQNINNKTIKTIKEKKETPKNAVESQVINIETKIGI